MHVFCTLTKLYFQLINKFFFFFSITVQSLNMQTISASALMIDPRCNHGNNKVLDTQNAFD